MTELRDNLEAAVTMPNQDKTPQPDWIVGGQKVVRVRSAKTNRGATIAGGSAIGSRSKTLFIRGLDREGRQMPSDLYIIETANQSYYTGPPDDLPLAPPLSQRIGEATRFATWEEAASLGRGMPPELLCRVTRLRPRGGTVDE